MGEVAQALFLDGRLIQSGAAGAGGRGVGNRNNEHKRATAMVCGVPE